jgi:hypothetical protein
VFGKANDNNTLSDAKLFATGRKLPTPAMDFPVATEPGQVTASDYWDAGMTSRITGDKGYFTFIDVHSGRFRVYCTKSKADAVKYTDEYYMDAAREGVDIKPGSIRYSDNEHIFTSAAMNDKSREHALLEEHSPEYEPWTNGACEVVHRYHPDYMRKLHHMSDLPHDFFPFTALAAQDILNAIRVREGQSCQERWNGIRPRIDRFRPIGCRAAVRMPLSWRGHKIMDQCVEAVYLWRNPRKPGANFWSPKYGMMTSNMYTLEEDRFPFKDDGWTLDDADDEQDDDYVPAGGGGGGPYVGPAPGDDDDGEDHDQSSSTSESSADSTDDTEHDSAGDGAAEVQSTESDTERATSEDEPVGDGSESSSVGQATHTATDDDEPQEPPAPQVPLRRSARLQGHALPQTVFNQTHLAEAERMLANVAIEHYDNICERIGTLASCERMQACSTPIPGPFADTRDMSDEFKQADAAEIEGLLRQHKAVIEVPLLQAQMENAKIYQGLMIRNIKADGRHKSRYAVDGSKMKCDKTQSPTLMAPSLRSICAICAKHDMVMACGDFTMAYLNAALPPSDRYYVYPPRGARQYDSDGNRIVWWVVKALYGGPDSGLRWYTELRKWFINQGYVASEADPCVFVKWNAEK